VDRRRSAIAFHQEHTVGKLGFGELAMIAAIVLLLFGARRLPEIGASIGKGIREFKRGVGGNDDSGRPLS
jgi:TatA/E family protein of Tat protein translocase